MKKYKCEICDKNHSFYYRIEAPLPEVISSISEIERNERIKLFHRFQFLDRKKVFVNGTICIEITELELYFNWIVWIEISGEEFLQVMSEYEKNNFEPRFKGKIVDDIFFYEGSRNISIEYVHNEEISDSVITVTNQNHQLGKDQKNGISIDKLKSWMSMIPHPELGKAKTVFSQPFSERLINELEEVSSKFMKGEKNFAINISNSRVTLFQIVNRPLLESTEDNEFGYGLHLSFDETDEDCITQINKFRNLDYDSSFEFHNLDGVPTYQRDLNQNKSLLIELIENLVTDVYEEELEKIELYNFEI